MATVTFSRGSACDGTNHYDVTFRLGAESITLPIQHSVFSEPVTREEREAFLILLLRVLVEELTDRGVTHVRQILQNASLILRL